MRYKYRTERKKIVLLLLSSVLRHKFLFINDGENSSRSESPHCRKIICDTLQIHKLSFRLCRDQKRSFSLLFCGSFFPKQNTARTNMLLYIYTR